MGRGKDKTIKGTDLKNMSPQEIQGVHGIIKNRGILPNVRVRGTAVVRSHGGVSTRYGDGAEPGKYNEDKLS
jgi:hypothetical protein